MGVLVLFVIMLGLLKIFISVFVMVMCFFGKIMSVWLLCIVFIIVFVDIGLVGLIGNVLNSFSVGFIYQVLVICVWIVNIGLLGRNIVSSRLLRNDIWLIIMIVCLLILGMFFVLCSLM